MILFVFIKGSKESVCWKCVRTYASCLYVYMHIVPSSFAQANSPQRSSFSLMFLLVRISLVIEITH